MPFYPDSLYYYIEKHNYKAAFNVCKVYIKNFEETEENFTRIMTTGNQGYSLPSSIEISKSDSVLDSVRTEATKSKIDRNNPIFHYVIIMIFTFFNAYLAQGIRYILPKTLTHLYQIKKNELNDLINNDVNGNVAIINLELQIAATASGVISFMTGILIENSFFQRLRLLKLTGIFSCFVSYNAFFVRRYIDVFACILKSSITMQDQITEIYSAESFDTKRRVMLLSLANIVQSISNFISPLLNDIINSYSFRLNYLIFAIVLSFMMLLSFFMKKEKFKIVLN